MGFQYGNAFDVGSPEAYERLLYDCMAGDNTLFVGIEEVLASWRLFTPVLELWAQQPPEWLPYYAVGSWGPPEADALISATERLWRMM